MNFDEIRKDYKRKIKALFKLNESYYDIAHSKGLPRDNH